MWILYVHTWSVSIQIWTLILKAQCQRGKLKKTYPAIQLTFLHAALLAFNQIMFLCNNRMCSRYNKCHHLPLLAWEIHYYMYFLSLTMSAPEFNLIPRNLKKVFCNSVCFIVYITILQFYCFCSQMLRFSFNDFLHYIILQYLSEMCHWI